jgi:tripartite-type tricarboxylate transporter receptor subunit TctC
VFELMSVTADMQRPFLAPPGVPADRVAALCTAFRETIADPDYVADAEKGHKEAHLVSGEQLDALAKRVLGAPKSAIDLLRASLAR